MKAKQNDTPMPSVAKMMPSLSLDAEDLPEIKSWVVGGKYTLKVEVEQVSASKDDMMMEGEKKRPLHARFRVIAVKSLSSSHMDDEDKEKGKKIDRLKEKAEGEY